MFQLSDQHDDGRNTLQSNPSGVNKAYPGLVLVPPSDRTILRRRIVRGALVLIAVIWTIWTFTTQPPASDNNTPCRPDVDQPHKGSSPEECGTQSSTPEGDQHSSELSPTKVSQVTSPIEASPLPNIPHLDMDPSQTTPLADQPSPVHAEATELRTEPQAGHSEHEKPSGTRLPEKPVVNPESDTHLAEQGDPFAQYRLGRHLAKQEGRQAPEAGSWYRKAFTGLHRLAEAGNGQAMYVLGVMYAYGRGVERDISQARRWLTRAVDQKITAAQPVLASLPAPVRPSHSLQMHAAEQAKSRKQQN